MIGAYESIKVVASLDPVSKTATWSGTGVDITGFKDATICVYFGTGGTPLSGSVYYTVTFEESDTSGSGYTTIAAGDLGGGLSGTRVVDSNTEDNQIIKRTYRGTKQYVRATGTLTGSDSSGTLVASFVILSNPIHVAVTQVTET